MEKSRETKSQSLKGQEMKVLQRRPGCAHTDGQGLVVDPKRRMMLRMGEDEKMLQGEKMRRSLG